jgi:hypothetical protein
MRKRVSPGLVLGIVAVVLATSGSAVAASVITGKQVKDSSLTGADIKNHSLGLSELSNDAQVALVGAQGPAGPAGPMGAQGPAGPAGPSTLSAITTTASSKVYFGTEVAQGATAYCPPGQKVISGGGVSISDEQLAASEPNADRTGWFVIGIDLDYDVTSYVQATALCAQSGGAVATSADHADDERQITELADRVAAGRTRS